MAIQEAMEIVARACAAYMGTLQDHKTIQQALKTIAKHLATTDLATAGALPAEEDDNHGTA